MKKVNILFIPNTNTTSNTTNKFLNVLTSFSSLFHVDGGRMNISIKKHLNLSLLTWLFDYQQILVSSNRPVTPEFVVDQTQFQKLENKDSVDSGTDVNIQYCYFRQQ